MTTQKDVRLISGREFGEAKLPTLPKDVIGDGQIAVIAAQYGRGKTPLTAHMALEAACGLPLTPLGLNTCRSSVLVLDAESNSVRYREMFQRLMAASGVQEWPEALRFWFKLDAVLTPGKMSHDAILQLVREHNPGLLLLDPLRQFAGGYDLVKTRHATLIMDVLRGFQSVDPALRIVLPHHLRKRDMRVDQVPLADDPWAWLEQASGSLALLDHADVRLGFEEEKGKLVLAGIKRGVGIVGPWYFEVEEDSTGEPCRFRFEDQNNSIRARYAEFLNQLPDSFAWKEGRIALGISDSTMHRFIRAVIKSGMLTQGPDGIYHKVEVRK
jgi:hypothetical protein